MDIIRRALGPFGTNGYFLEGEHPIIVDAPSGILKSLAPFLKKKTPAYLFLTHTHWDHIADAAALKQAFPEMKIVVSRKDLYNLEKPGSDGIPCFIRINPAKGDLFPEEGSIIEGFEVMTTPGHSPGGLCFYHPKEKVLFSGDTLFKGTIGNLSLPTSDPSLMWKSLAKLATLPSDTIVYPGHGEKTSIGEESFDYNF